MEITAKKFTLESTFDEPKTATYKNIMLMSKGEGGNRYMYVYDHGVEVSRFWVDTHCDTDACFIHTVSGIYGLILVDCLSKHARFDGWFWCLKTWDEYEIMMHDFISYLKV